MGARFSLRLSTKMGLQTPQTVEVDPTRDDWFRDKRWAGLFQGFRGIAIEFLDRRQKPSPIPRQSRTASPSGGRWSP
jgi:hypothetical protein